MSGRTSTNPARAHSLLTISLILLSSRGCATVLVGGKVSGRLLKPYAMAASSIKSHSCMISERVGGTCTDTASGLEGSWTAERVMRSSKSIKAVESTAKPVHELTYDA